VIAVLKLNTLKSEKERLEKYIGMSDVRFGLEARLATVYADLMEKRRKAHDHNKHVKEAIVAKQEALEKEKISTAEILKDLDEKIAEIAGAKAVWKVISRASPIWAKAWRVRGEPGARSVEQRQGPPAPY
jgi:hypothetical protein